MERAEFIPRTQAELKGQLAHFLSYPAIDSAQHLLLLTFSGLKALMIFYDSKHY